MSDVSMIGLGKMGAAVAEGIQAGGRGMTVWNRSADKMQPFVAKGASGASNIAEAAAASPLLVVCIDDYNATRGLFEAGQTLKHIPDRTVVQLSTGTPDEALESAECFQSHGAAYIDGAILGGPDKGIAGQMTTATKGLE